MRRRQAALLGHQMQRHEDVEGHRPAAAVGQAAAQIGVELAGVADEHDVVGWGMAMRPDELPVGGGDALPESRPPPAAAGLGHAIFNPLPQRHVADLHGHVGLGL